MAVNLVEVYREAAQMCRDAGVPLDAEPGGAIHQWVVQNVKHRPDTAFWIVTGIASAMADLDAQDEGYADQIDRALAKMREGEAYKRHQARQARLPRGFRS